MAGRGLAVALLAGGLSAVPQAGAHGTPTRPGMTEAKLLRVETKVLGRTHAREHLRARREARRLDAHPRPKPKRAKLAGDPSVVGQWSGRHPVDVTGIHAILLPTGKVLLFSYGTTADTSVGTLWDPATHTGKRIATPNENIWCAGQTLLADGRVLVVGGNIPKSGNENFRGLDSIWIFDPWTEKWAFQGRMNDGRWYPTTTLLPDGRVVITSGLSADGSADLNPDVEVFTPSPDRSKPGTITTVGERTFNLYPFQFVVRSGRMLVAGPFRDDRGLLNPANWTWDAAMPRLLGNHYYGSAVLLPDGPSGVEQGDGDRGRPADEHRGDRRGESRRRVEPARAAARAPPQRQQRAHRRRRDHHDRRERGGQLRGAAVRGPAIRPGRRHVVAPGLPGRGARVSLDGPAAARRAHRLGRRRRGRRRRRRDRGLLAALPLQGRAAHDHVGAGRGGLRGRLLGHDLRSGPGPRRADGARRDHPRQRHAPAPGAAVHDARRRRPHRPDGPRHPGDRPARLLPARARERGRRPLGGPLPAPRR